MRSIAKVCRLKTSLCDDEKDNALGLFACIIIFKVDVMMQKQV